MRARVAEESKMVGLKNHPRDHHHHPCTPRSLSLCLLFFLSEFNLSDFCHISLSSHYVRRRRRRRKVGQGVEVVGSLKEAHYIFMYSLIYISQCTMLSNAFKSSYMSQKLLQIGSAAKLRDFVVHFSNHGSTTSRERGNQSESFTPCEKGGVWLLVGAGNSRWLGLYLLEHKAKNKRQASRMTKGRGGKSLWFFQEERDEDKKNKEKGGESGRKSAESKPN